MAKKTSFKNQIYQQITNQQVQQVLNQQREQQTANLMADFNSFMEQQQNPEALMADFNSWKEQNKQPVQSVSQPTVQNKPTEWAVDRSIYVDRPGDKYNKAKAAEAISKRQAFLENRKRNQGLIPSIADLASENVSNAFKEPINKVELKAEEKKKIGQRPEATDFSSQVAARPVDRETIIRGGKKWNESVNNTLNMLNSKEIKDVNAYQKLVQANEAKAAVENEQETPAINSSINQIDLSQYNLPEEGISEQDRKALEDYSKAIQWLDANYRMTKDEQKEAKRIAYEGKQALAEKYPVTNKADYGKLLDRMTPEDRQKYLAFEDLGNKADSLAAFSVGAADEAVKMGGGLFDTYALFHPFNPNAARSAKAYKELVQDNWNEKAEGMKELAQNATPLAENVPVIGEITPYGAGKTAAQMGAYLATNDAFDELGSMVLGNGKVAGFLGNQIGQNLQDVFLDTIPRYNELKAQGYSEEEIRDTLTKEGLMNAAGNALFGGALEIPGLVKSGIDNVTTKKAADAAFRENVRAGADNLSKIANEIPGIEDVDNITRNTVRQIEDSENAVRNAARQAEEAAQNIEPEPVKETVKDSVKAVKPEYVIDSITRKNRDGSKSIQYFAREKYSGQRVNPFLESDTPEGAIRVANNTFNFMMDTDKGFSQSVKEAWLKNGIIAPSDIEPEPVKEMVEEVAKRGPELSAETQEQIASDFEEIYNAVEDMRSIVESSGDAKIAEKYSKLQDAVWNYEKLVYNSDSLEEINKAKKAADAARQGFIRAAKKIDPNFKGSLTGTKLGNAEFRRTSTAPTDSALLDEIVEDMVKQDMENPNRFVRDAKPDNVNVYRGVNSEVPKDYSIQEVNRKGGKKGYYVAESVGDGATKNVEPGKVYKTKKEAENALGNYKLQTFAGGDTPKEKWNVSKYRTNTVEKQGWGDKLSEKHFGYRVYSEAEQNADAAAKNLSADDLIYKDQFDPSDVKQAMKRQRELLASDNEEDIFKADRLARKLAAETREAGRVPQALAEFDRTTPEGQVRLAQRAIDDIVDKKVGTGTSEALDNIVEKINKAYDKHGNDKKAFADEVSDILSGTLRENVKSKVAKKMAPKAIKGKDKVLSMIANGATLEDIADVVYKQNGGAKLSAMENKQIYDMLVDAQKLPEGSYEQEELIARAAKIATNKTPSTLGQKIRNILYNNMLGNLKTAVSRNFFGNLTYQTLEQGRQPISAVIDKATSAVTKKHSALGWNKGKAQAYLSGFKQGGSDQIKDIARHIDTGRSGSKGWENALKNNATTYSNDNAIGKFLNNVQYYVTNAMELGDRPFFEANYKQAVTELHQMVDRYGKDGVAGLEGIKDADIDDVIDMIASVHAADSVFQKQGKMSKALTSIRNGLGQMSEGAVGVDILSTASTPFTMTPGNMLERAIEYTPLGFVKNAAETAGEVLGKKGFNQRRFVDEASRSIAGLPILYGAYKLAENGSINGGLSTDKDEKQAQLDDGFIEYGYNVPDNVPILGGKSLDTSDLPVIGPFMQAGAVIAENGLTPSAAFQAGEAVLGGSATQGLRRAFGGDSSSYSSQNGILENLKNTFLSSGSQLIPSLARQTAQTIDPYKRDLGEYGTSEYYFNLLKNADPVGRQSLPIKYDTEGQPILQNQGRNIGSKILENYLLPMNVSEYKPTALNQEASRLREVADTAQGFTPKADRADLRKWDETAQKEYTEEQFREYKKDLGTLNSSAGNAVIESDFYKNLDDGTKAKTLSSVYSAMKSIAKENATGIQTDDKIAIAYKNGGAEGMINYLAGKDAVKDSGTTSQSKVGQAIQEAADNGNTEAAYDMAEQVQLLPTYGLDKPGPGATYTKAYNVYDGLSAQDFAKVYNAIDTDHNQGLKKTEVLEYMNKQHFNEDDGMKFWKAYAVTEGSRAWKIPSLNDNTWK